MLAPANVVVVAQPLPRATPVLVVVDVAPAVAKYNAGPCCCAATNEDKKSRNNPNDNKSAKINRKKLTAHTHTHIQSKKRKLAADPGHS